jgi:ribosome-associated translation inhibitor RaiA
MALPTLLPTPNRSIPISIKGRGLRVDDDVQRSVHACVGASLGRFGKRIRSVSAVIEDTNGPRDGSGMRCVMTVVLDRPGRISASAEAPTWQAAVATAATRVRTMLDRVVKKRRAVYRRSVPGRGQQS